MSQHIQTAPSGPVVINPPPTPDDTDEYEHAKFGVLHREIFCRADLDEFKQTETYKQWLQFITELTDSVKGLPCSTECPISPPVQHVIDMLRELQRWVAEIPPLENLKSRFGNPAFRTWYERVVARAPEMWQWLNSSVAAEQQREIMGYWCHCFGSAVRLDYGTGHESHFIAVLYCLTRVHVIGQDDYRALVLRVLSEYLALMRQLQTVYWLEPAGSHGVWGLDDYHVLPFLFGASQLSEHKHIRPKSIHSAEVVEGYAREWLYLQCIQFINSVKTASLAWHSPMLNDISGVASWGKIAQGLLKMYTHDVLDKLPIMQHFLFGSLLPFHASHQHEHVTGAEQPEHVHEETEFPSCCISKLPSAAAVKAVNRNTFVPFD
eukprot:TRINITY_DN4652_c0_g1_i1.p1 TRINITY_DN4652_c0_g1~~TRINITY_DN4652_c0_g1_i1.p1  ORF type:complete len:378 (+),score=139.21 TRINITY_DN4652_c0_g1_i1:99-1232(+)